MCGETGGNRNREYYEAYDDRYRQVHGKSLLWFSEVPSKIVEEVMRRYQITRSMKCLEIGCGEGRDALHLLKQEYHLLATDLSRTAIDYCKSKLPEKPESFQVLNCLTDRIDERFDFIYAIAVLHMLVLDRDRSRFYRFLHAQLSDTGIALICTMGDGREEWHSDVATAFELQKRNHEASGEELYLAGTSCRKVRFETFFREIEGSDLTLLESGMTSMEPDFPVMMYAVVKRNIGGCACAARICDSCTAGAQPPLPAKDAAMPPEH